MTKSDWFPGEGRNPDDEEFLVELRALAAHHGLADVRPQDTGTAIYAEQWVVAWARVPRLPADADVMLQVGYGPGDPDVPALVACWETHGYLLDQWEELEGRESTSTERAHRAFGWMTDQLGRPVTRRDWRRRWRADASEYVLADTDRLLWAERVSALRLPRGVPRLTRLR